MARLELTRSLKWIPCVAALAGVTPLASADVILGVDFTGRTVSGNTAGNIAYVLNGVADPGDLTAVESEDIAGAKLAGLFDTAATADYFAPDLNIGNEDNWSVTIPLTLTVSSVTIDELVMNGLMFNGTGNVWENSSFTVPVRISFVDTANNVELASFNTTVSRSGTAAPSWTLTLDLSTSGIQLDDSTTWAMVFETKTNVPNATPRHLGVADITLHGNAIPEPASLALAGLSAMLILGRHRSA